MKFVKSLFLAVLCFFGLALSAKADTDPSAAVVAQVQGITTTATTSWVSAVALGVAILIVSVIVYVSKRGWKLR